MYYLIGQNHIYFKSKTINLLQSPRVDLVSPSTLFALAITNFWGRETIEIDNLKLSRPWYSERRDALLFLVEKGWV